MPIPEAYQYDPEIIIEQAYRLNHFIDEERLALVALFSAPSYNQNLRQQLYEITDYVAHTEQVIDRLIEKSQDPDIAHALSKVA